MIRQKDVEKCRFFTTTGGDIWKVKKNRVVTELELLNCETGKTEMCRVGEQSAERFIPIGMPAVSATHRGRPRIKRTEDKGRKTEGKRRGRPPKKSKLKTENSKLKTKPSSQYLGVTVRQEKKGPRYYAQISRGGEYKNLGIHNVEELAAAAVQEHIGNHAEAKRLRKLAKQKTDTAIDELKGNAGPVRFLCNGCGADYPWRPEKCVKCGSGSFEKIQPEGKKV